MIILKVQGHPVTHRKTLSQNKPTNRNSKKKTMVDQWQSASLVCAKGGIGVHGGEEEIKEETNTFKIGLVFYHNSERHGPCPRNGDCMHEVWGTGAIFMQFAVACIFVSVPLQSPGGRGVGIRNIC